MNDAIDSKDVSRRLLSFYPFYSKSLKIYS